ncbi:MAG: Gfo/Idh/MocA family oxidoreductase [Oscillospiraceae bacterium]|nr:Gfo/Idh/MocA family oxidoreductase [Oscillospiraceae bacterium]
MFKVAILGCENSHGYCFVDSVINHNLVDDVEFVGVYSDEEGAADKYAKDFGIYVAKSYDEFVGKVDGIIITARHGDNHYKYAKPYIDSGIPMFIDKPITCSEEDAKAFMAELKAKNVPVCGGSCCAHADIVHELKQLVAEGNNGKVCGGYLRCPLVIDHVEYGGFYFYSQHLVEPSLDIFGHFPNSVMMYPSYPNYNCIVRYDNYDIFLDFNSDYSLVNDLCYASVNFDLDVIGRTYSYDGLFDREFLEFHDLLLGKPQHKTYEEFFAPVYVINAMKRSLEGGKEEIVHRCTD